MPGAVKISLSDIDGNLIDGTIYMDNSYQSSKGFLYDRLIGLFSKCQARRQFQPRRKDKG